MSWSPGPASNRRESSQISLRPRFCRVQFHKQFRYGGVADSQISARRHSQTLELSARILGFSHDCQPRIAGSVPPANRSFEAWKRPECLAGFVLPVLGLPAKCLTALARSSCEPSPFFDGDLSPRVVDQPSLLQDSGGDRHPGPAGTERKFGDGRRGAVSPLPRGSSSFEL
jgi:hypothetical protein